MYNPKRTFYNVYPTEMFSLPDSYSALASARPLFGEKVLAACYCNKSFVTAPPITLSTGLVYSKTLGHCSTAPARPMGTHLLDFRAWHFKAITADKKVGGT